MTRSKMSNYEINEATKFIYSLYLENGRGLEEEECISEEWITYFEARKDYRYGYLDSGFWQFVEEKIIGHIKKLRKIKNERLNNESPISLNMHIGNNKESIGTYLFPVKGDFVNSIILWNYARSLGREKYLILKLLSQYEEDYQIMERLHLSIDQFYNTKLELREDLYKYMNY